MQPPKSLEPGEVHVWYWSARETIDLDALSRVATAWLSEEERRATARVSHEKTRRHKLQAQLLARAVLSKYAAMAPAAWRFRRNPHGRPELEAQLPEALYFNLSHSGSVAACAVSRHAEVGFDLEETSRDVRFLELARSRFSRVEFESLAALPASEQRERFFQYWTLKEAYLKARGMGLALPLDQFSFSLGGSIGIAFGPGIADRPEEWRFRLSSFVPGYQAAVAVRSRASLSLIERDFAL